MKVAVKILPRKDVLDSQGRAVEKTLSQYGKSVQSCKVGKYIQLDFAGESESQALAKAKDIAEFVLVNPLIESFELELVPQTSGDQ